ncbi:UNVERIFIED_CONTAM: hypothetical protein PYX00_000579 [Menopon gallinae]|uniref:Fanconi-associated nuclease n=1 Tax=Menopon gallinae TaxID=328185 RepID=A0AAW2IB49_9NEOP
MFCDIIRCLGISKFADICERLVRDFKVYRSGFPDLTLWNPETGKCKFVEVKGPNDKLSPKQMIWLDFLSKINVDCEVCNVKNTASKSPSS